MAERALLLSIMKAVEESKDNFLARLREEVATAASKNSGQSRRKVVEHKFYLRFEGPSVK